MSMHHAIKSTTVAVAGAVLGWGPAALALVPPNYDPVVHDRFVSGYVETVVMTQAPVLNISPSFLGYGYDLSGIGWNTVEGPGCSATVAGVTMISPMHIAHSGHLSIPQGKITFLSGDGRLHFATEQLKISLLSSGDGAIGPLLKPVSRSAKIATYAVLDIGAGDQPSRYGNQPLLVYGRAAKLAASTFVPPTSITRWTETGGAFDLNNVELLGGDSGSPSFIPYQGKLTLAGTHWQRRPSSGDGYDYRGGVDAAWVNPYAIAAANGVMAQAGYAVKVIAVPSKVWDGGAGTGAFATAANWAPNAVPNREGIAFDAGSANGQYNIDVTGAGSVKGITFTPTAGPGFTFSGSTTLQLGTGGLINNSSQTQTFNNDIQLRYVIKTPTGTPVETGAQHWSADAGNLVINGNVDTTAFQLVVDGACDTVINGVISGWGGLGKEGAGKLTLARANVHRGYTTLTEGTLAINNTTGSATGTGDVNVWGGRLQGKGRISGAVTFGAIGDDQWLSPGNADAGQRGVLTIGGGVTLSTDTTFEIHLDGLNPGDGGYDQLRITGGSVDLGQAVLDLSVGANVNLASGDAFWILNNTGNGSLIGTFNGLSNGETFLAAHGRSFEIFYAADFASRTLDGGNDIVLVSSGGVNNLVPEPASMCMVGLLIAMMSLRRVRSTAAEENDNVKA